MQRTEFGAAPAYSAQATVDVATQLIVAADVTVAQTDHASLLPQIEQAQRNTGTTPTAVLADAGYSNGPNLAALQASSLDAFVAQQREPARAEFPRSRFTRHDVSDTYTCPAGRELRFERREQRPSASGPYSRRVYRCVDCSECALAAACKDPRTARRSLRVSEHDALHQAMRARCASEEGRRAYAQRKSSIEPVFGTIKSALGVRRFMRRGLPAVCAEWTLICSAFNLRKLASAIRRARQAA